MGILFNFTKQMDFRKAFAVAATVIVILAFYFLIAIKDPDLSKHKLKLYSRHSITEVQQADGPPGKNYYGQSLW